MYQGPEPESEPEVFAVKRALLKHKKQLMAYLTIHSYYQLWMTRWAYTNQTIQDHNDQVCDVAFQSLELPTMGNRFRIFA